MNKLNESQSQSFKENGFILIENAIPENVIVNQLEALHALFGLNGHEKAERDYFATNAVSKSDPVLDFIDDENFFPYILDLLGPFIQLSSSHVLIRPGAKSFDLPMHVDGGACMESVIPEVAHFPLQVKVQIFLTDVINEDSGNFVLVPGSHKNKFPFYDKNSLLSMKRNSVQLVAKRGDIAIFTNNLWHSAAVNNSQNDRKSIILGYSQMFLRSFDYVQADEKTLNRATARQKLLLGDIGYIQPQAKYYPPSDFITKIENISSFEIEDLLKKDWSIINGNQFHGNGNSESFNFEMIKEEGDDFVTWEQVESRLPILEEKNSKTFATYADAKFLVDNQELIPSSLTEKNLIFAGTKFKSSTGHHHYSVLSFVNGKWKMGMYWILFEFHENEYMALKPL